MKKVTVALEFQVPDNVYKSENFIKFFEEFKRDMENPNMGAVEKRFELTELKGKVTVE